MGVTSDCSVQKSIGLFSKVLQVVEACSACVREGCSSVREYPPRSVLLCIYSSGKMYPTSLPNTPEERQQGSTAYLVFHEYDEDRCLQLCD